MSDQGAPTGQESSGATNQQGQESAGAQGQQSGQESGSGDQQQGSTFDLNTITDPTVRSYVETVQRQAAEARNEAARYRTERGTLQQQVEQFQRQNETAEQQAQREQAEREAETERLRAEVRDLRVGSTFTGAATAAHALDPAALLALIGGPSKVELDDEGKPTNIDALIAKARTDYPWAFSRTSADAGAGSGQQQQPTRSNMNDFIRGRR